MYFRRLSIIFCLLMSMIASGELTADLTNPLQIPDPRNTVNGQVIVFRFSFPAASLGDVGPTTANSPGLAYKQFLGVVFPASTATFDLELDKGFSPKWSCALSDGTYSYTVTAVKSVVSPITPSLTSETNIAYCRLDDTSTNAPLKAISSITYTLSITFTGTTKIASNYVRSIGLFTATANHADKIIIDYSPVFGSIGIYTDYSKSIMLDVVASLITVNSEPSFTTKAPTIYPTNYFDVTLTIKSFGFITAADNLIVFKYDSTVVSFISATVSSTENAPNNPLQTALKGSLTFKAFGTGAYYIDGIAEDIIPNRQFKLTIKGWKAADLPATNSAVQLIVYYKNTYSILSYLSYPLITITKDTSSLTANHPEFWDVYRGGAWPIAFTFKTSTDLANGGWVVIRHTNFASPSSSAGNQVTFVPSTCDFSDNNVSLIDQGFGSRNNCFPLRPLDNTYSEQNGSGFFFYLKGPISFKNTYKVTIWAFFDLCGGLNDASMNILGATASIFTTQPTFNISIYKTMDPSKLNENRFSSANILSSSTDTTFGQYCWNHPATVSDALVLDIWKDTTKVTVKSNSVSADNVIAFIGYKEISQWVIFSETQDDHSSLALANWYANPKLADLSSSSTGIKFLYSNSVSNVITSGSFFLAAFNIPATSLATAFNYLRLPMPLVNGALYYDELAPGRFSWQFPSKWFVQGKDFKSASSGTCYCSWYTNKSGANDIQVSNQILATLASEKLDYSLNSAQNNHFFGAGGMNLGVAVGNQIDEVKTYLGGDSTKTGKDSIFRVTSVYHNGGNTSLWRFGDPAKIILLTTANPINVGLFSSCVKWNPSLPTITSLYTSIDIHIKWNFTSTASWPEVTSADGRPLMIWRLIKLYPETGVAQDWAKNSGSGISGPLLLHNVYSSSTNEAVCILEVGASFFGPLKDAASNTLILWLFGGTILESDYSDVTSTYPAAPLNNNISVYGNQNGYNLDLNNPYAVVGSNKTPILEMLASVNNGVFPLGTLDIPWATASSNYFFFMGSTIYLTGITSNFLSGPSDNTNNIFIPYYCPRFPSGYMTAGSTVGIKYALFFPVIMSAYVNMSAYNSISSVNRLVQFEGGRGTNKLIKVMIAYPGKSNAITSGFSAGSVYQATLKWSPYSTTDSTQNNLYVYNGSVNVAGTALICTSHSLFLHASLKIENLAPEFFAFPPTNGGTGYYAGTKTFYILGKAFQKALFYGIGNSGAFPSVNNMVATIADGSVLSSTFVKNVKRPAIDFFLNSSNVHVLSDRIAYFCTPFNNNKNYVLTNYVTNAFSSNGVGSFLLDWSRNTNAAWTNFSSISYDNNDVYRLDPAANFKVTLTPPASVPSGTTLKFLTGSFGNNLICGIVESANLATTVSSECTVSGNLVSCTAPVRSNNFTVCCYNFLLTDPITVSAITASFSNEQGVSAMMTNDVYINPVGSNSFFSLATTTTTDEILTSKSAVITSATYSQTSQESGIGKITFTILLPREPIRNMKLTISSTKLTDLMIPNSTPRCTASLSSKGVFGSTWETGDVLIEGCSANNLSSGSILVTTKNIIYKCGVKFNKTMYISLWPVIAFHWSAIQTNAFKVNIFLGDTAIARNDTGAVWAIFPPLSTNLPDVTAQWDTLCEVSSISPRVPGELADWTFVIDLLTNQDSLRYTAANEVSIFFPFNHFGASMNSLLCYLDTTLLNCSFTDEAILNIRFSSRLPVGKKTSILLVGIRNPALDYDIRIACTVNTSNWETGVRTINMTGSGKLTGGINTSALISNGVIRFLNISSAVSDKNPRNLSSHKFRVTFDYGVGLTATIITIQSPILHIYFPQDYKLFYFPLNCKVLIDEFTSDTSNKIEKTSTYTSLTTTVSGNRITVKFPQTAITLGTTFRYWDISVEGVVNPFEDTLRTSAPLTGTTRPFNILLQSADARSLYKTYSNLNSYSSEALGYTVDQNLAWNRGNSFSFDNTKWVLDIYAIEGVLNSLVIKTGRYLKAFITVKADFSKRRLHTVNSISLYDLVFKTSEGSYTYITAYNQPVTMWIGTTCKTAPGSYVIFFTTSDNINFVPGIPITVSVINNTKGVISFNSPVSVPFAGTSVIQYFLSEPNFDELDIKWSKQNANYDSSANISSIVIKEFTVTPMAFNTSIMSPVFSIFSFPSNSASLSRQAFKIVDPNFCFTFGNLNTLNIDISGGNAALTSVDLSTSFKYFNADSDVTITSKNSLKFTFIPPSNHMYIYCAFAEIHNCYPADNDIITPNISSTNYLQFYSNFISSIDPIDITFSNLSRGTQYKLRCIIKSTETNLAIRTTSTINFESFPAGASVMDILPSKATTKCAKWEFASDPGTEAKKALVDYCQKVFSAPGYSANGCVSCTFPDFSYAVTGVTLTSNLTCSTNVSVGARHLESEGTDSSIVTVCAIPRSDCTNDAISGKTYSDFFNKFTEDLKSSDLLATNLGLYNLTLKANTLKIMDDVNCKSKILPVYFACPELCPYNSTFLKNSTLCSNCRTLNKISYNNTCVDSCPNQTVYDSDSNSCSVPLRDFLNPKTEDVSCFPNPCNNNGVCNLKFLQIECLCKEKFFGKLCEYNMQDYDIVHSQYFRVISNLNTFLSESQIRKIDELNTIINQNPSFATKNISEHIINLTYNLYSSVEKGKIRVNPNFLNVFNLAINTKIKLFINLNESLLKPGFQNDIYNLKNITNSIIDKLIQDTNWSETENSSVLLGKSIFSVQLASTTNSSLKEMNDRALKERLAQVDLKDCEMKIREKNNIPETRILILRKTEYDSIINLDLIENDYTSNYLSFSFYDPENNIKFSTKICNDTKVTLSYPLKEETIEKLNLNKYYKFVKEGVDIFNSNSPAFQSRCVKLRDNLTDFDTTINFRRSIYYENLTISCGTNCNYDQINPVKYVECICSVLDDSEYSNTFEEFLLGSLPSFNIEIFTCFFEVFVTSALWGNIGLHYSLILMFLTILLFYILPLIFAKKMDKNTDKILYYDCEFYNPDEISADDYFLKKTPKKEKLNNHDAITSYKQNIDSSDKLSGGDSSKSVSKKYDKKYYTHSKRNSEVLPFQSSFKIEDIEGSKFHNHMYQDQIIGPKIKSSTGSENLMDQIQNKDKESDNVKLILRENNFKENKLNIENEKEKENENENNPHKFPDFVENKINEKDYDQESITTTTFLLDENHKFSRKDYENLKPFEKLKYDNRSFYEYMRDTLVEEHPLLNIIFNKSLKNPIDIRVLILFTSFNINFATNALLFSDDYIDQRANADKDDRQSFFYTAAQEALKTILCLIFSTTLDSLLGFVFQLPNSTIEELNRSMLSKNLDKIREAYNRIKKKRIIILIISSIVNLLCFYYIIIFCGIYISSSSGWVQGCIQSLILDWIAFALGLPILLFGIKAVIRKCPKLL